LYNSPSCAQVCGYGPEALAADPALFLRLIHPDDQPGFLQHRSPPDSHPMHADQNELEFRIRHGDGSERWIAHVCQPIFDENGRWLGNRGSNRDITERKCLQVELDQHRQHLEALVASRTLELNQALILAEAGSRAKSQFLANMGHELRTPMNAIIGMAHLAQQASTEPAAKEKIQHVREAANHLLGIINDVLDLSCLEDGQLFLDNSLFSLDQLIEAAIARTQTAAVAKGLRLDCEIDPELHGDYRGDPLRLTQVLKNFLSNAVKFTEQGRVVLRASR
jgi:PAS domain S-box-containing protein